ncbi:MAG: HIT domain-containing protein [Candidatus Nomurabacteria bacterium]|jgi:diadenosine tetraphosphate (Ap4A) HIT family hydrolase|nr:HIT domain-containing protein [Candidatus Nomurabacteria bacterium]
MVRNISITISRRARQVEARYLKYKSKHPECTFCKIGKKGNGNEIIDETKHFWIVTNLFPYELWDGRKVLTHLLVVPKDHFHNIDEMTHSERITLIEILGRYEKRGYSFYGRAPQNASRSMEHQHTHLIKVEELGE